MASSHWANMANPEDVCVMCTAHVKPAGATNGIVTLSDCQNLGEAFEAPSSLAQI